MSKYRSVREVVEGKSFDSKAEARRFRELRLLERAGQITGLKLQQAFPLCCGGKPVLIRSEGYPNGRAARYVADFVYDDARTGQRVVEDVKGFDVPISRLKRALVEAEYGVVVRVVK